MSTATPHHTHPPAPKRVLSNIPEPKKKSGAAGATVNLINAIVGSGIIGIPYTLKESGFVVGLTLLAFVAYLTVRSLRMIVETAAFHPKLKMVGVKTYEDLMFIPYGTLGSNFILINKLVFAYGCMVAYLLIVKDTVPVLLGVQDNELYRQLIMVGTSLLIMLPLSLQRDMASLAFTSLLSVTADILLIVFLSIYSPVAESVNEAGGMGIVLKENAFNPHLFIGLGIISQAMTCQPQALMIHGSLENKASSNWGLVAQIALVIAWLMCTVFGVVGFLGYLDETEGDILINLESGWMADACRGLVAIHLTFVYPMQIFVVRHVLAKVLYNGDSEGRIHNKDGTTHVPKSCFCLGRLQIMTLAIFVATIIPALIFDDLGPVLSITGAIGGSCLAYIGPGLIYLGAHGEYFLQYTNEMCGRKSSTDPSVELPAEGDANAKMEEESLVDASTGRAPCWWCLLGIPLWRRIALSGSEGMKLRLQQIEEESPGATTVPPTGEVIGPMNSDFYWAMFLVLFGVVAVVAGVASNIVVQWYA